MKKYEEQHIDLITAWIDGSITPQEQEMLLELIDSGEIDRAEIGAMKSLYRDTGKMPVPEPSEESRRRFYDMLKEAQKNEGSPGRVTDIVSNRSLYRQFQRWAAVAAVFLAGLLIGNLLTPFHNYRQDILQLSSEVSQMREELMVLSLLDDGSPVERLKAVNIGRTIESTDHRVIEALLTTLNNDPNVNVRLASIEALIEHGDKAIVRQGLVKSISGQQSPQVQVALADAMLELGETDSINEFRHLLNRGELVGAVRDKLEMTIAALN